jgi:hypothetical protein
LVARQAHLVENQRRGSARARECVVELSDPLEREVGLARRERPIDHPSCPGTMDDRTDAGRSRSSSSGSPLVLVFRSGAFSLSDDHRYGCGTVTPPVAAAAVVAPPAEGAGVACVEGAAMGCAGASGVEVMVTATDPFTAFFC